jgi:glycerophosphoryl diester phosphodiesterase
MPEIESVGQKRPLVVGHRGASADLPENTLLAFEGAIAAGADMVELDVRLSSDEVPVIMHDADVGATTDGSGFVHTLSLAQLKRLDASHGTAPPTEVPTLEEALQLLSGRAGVNVEIKNLPGEPSFDSPREAVVGATLDLLDRTPFEGPVLISSFNWLSIERVRTLAPGLATGFLAPAMIDPWAGLVYVRGEGHAYVLPQAPGLLEAGAGFVDEAHGAGVLVGTWTVDDPETIDALFRMGADAIATNRPDVAVPIRDRFLASRSSLRQRPG